MSEIFTIVLCTRNPKREHLTACLASIESQNYPSDKWGVVLLDNGSSPSVSSLGFRLPSNLKLVLHETPGFNSARRAGVEAACGEWIVYVDDDNVLDPNYLSEAAQVIERHPHLDLFCGQIRGRFQSNPPDWSREFLGSLAIKEFDNEQEGRWPLQSWMPTWTAGMVARRKVVSAYFKLVEKDEFRQRLLRCEDHDFVKWALNQGACVGRVPSLAMEHIIPDERLQPKYLRKLIYEQGVMLGQIAARDSEGLYVLLVERVRAIKSLFWAICFYRRNSRMIRVAGAYGYLLGLSKRRKR